MASGSGQWWYQWIAVVASLSQAVSLEDPFKLFYGQLVYTRPLARNAVQCTLYIILRGQEVRRSHLPINHVARLIWWILSREQCYKLIILLYLSWLSVLSRSLNIAKLIYFNWPTRHDWPEPTEAYSRWCFGVFPTNCYRSWCWQEMEYNTRQ